MEKVNFYIKMVLIMKVNLLMEKNVDMGYINGIMINIMKVSGKMINNGYGIYHDKNKIIKGIWIDGKIRKIRNRNKGSVKRFKTYKINDKKNEKEVFDKKGITQEHFYKRYNLSEKKDKNKSVKNLNSSTTFFDKDIQTNFISHLNINLDGNNRSSTGSNENIENLENNKSY